MLSAVREFVQGLDMGASPDIKDTQKYTGLMLNVLKATEKWCTTECSEPGDSAGLKRLVGKSAVVHKLKVLQDAVDKKKPVDMDTVKILKKFKWTLNADQYAVVNGLMKKGLRAHRVGATPGAIRDKDPADVSTGALAATKDVAKMTELFTSSKDAAMHFKPHACPADASRDPNLRGED